MTLLNSGEITLSSSSSCEKLYFRNMLDLLGLNGPKQGADIDIVVNQEGVTANFTDFPGNIEEALETLSQEYEAEDLSINIQFYGDAAGTYYYGPGSVSLEVLSEEESMIRSSGYHSYYSAQARDIASGVYDIVKKNYPEMQPGSDRYFRTLDEIEQYLKKIPT